MITRTLRFLLACLVIAFAVGALDVSPAFAQDQPGPPASTAGEPPPFPDRLTDPNITWQHIQNYCREYPQVPQCRGVDTGSGTQAGTSTDLTSAGDIVVQRGGVGSLVPSETIVAFANVLSQCWGCYVTNFLFDHGVRFSFEFYDFVAPKVLIILVLIFGIYVIFQVARVFMPFGPMMGSSEWNNLLWRFILLMFVSIILSYPETYWYWMVAPILNIGAGLTELISQPGRFSGALFEVIRNLPFEGCVSSEFASFRPRSIAVASSHTSTYDAIKDVWGLMNCLLAKAHGVYGTFFGVLLSGITTTSAADSELIAAFGMAIQIIFTMIAILVLYIALIIYTLAILDVALKALYLSISAPFMFAGFVFNVTRGMFKETLFGLIRSASALFFVTLAFIISLNLFALGAQKYVDNDNIKLIHKINVASEVRYNLDQLSQDNQERIENESRGVWGNVVGGVRSGWEASQNFLAKGFTRTPLVKTTVSAPARGKTCKERFIDTPTSRHYLEELENAVKLDCIKYYTFLSAGYWYTLFSGILAIILMRMARSYSDNLINQVGGQAGQAASTLATQAGVATSGFLGSGLTGVATIGGGLGQAGMQMVAIRKMHQLSKSLNSKGDKK